MLSQLSLLIYVDKPSKYIFAVKFGVFINAVTAFLKLPSDVFVFQLSFAIKAVGELKYKGLVL